MDVLGNLGIVHEKRVRQCLGGVVREPGINPADSPDFIVAYGERSEVNEYWNTESAVMCAQLR